MGSTLPPHPPSHLPSQQQDQQKSSLRSLSFTWLTTLFLCCLPFGALLQEVVLALLFAGADTKPKDARGFDVMIEAARGNREDVIDVLKRSGARTGISVVLQVSLMVLSGLSLAGQALCLIADTHTHCCL